MGMNGESMAEDMGMDGESGVGDKISMDGEGMGGGRTR